MPVRFFAFVGITAILIAAAFVVREVFPKLDLQTIGTLIGLGEVAAVIALSFLPAERDSKQARCRAYDPYFGPGLAHGLGFEFEAKVVNNGGGSDVLEEVRYSLYKGVMLVDRGKLVAGAKELLAATGQVLPCPIKPQLTYVVHAFHTIGVKLTVEAQIRANKAPFILRCGFRFAESRSTSLQVIRAEGQIPWPRRLLYSANAFLRG